MRVFRKWKEVKSRGHDESGATIVLFAIMMLVLIPLVALGIDLAHWYYVGAEEQKAVDAAALAGVARLNNGGLTGADGATTVANDILTRNGFGSDSKTTISIAQVPGTNNQLRVTSVRSIRPYFAGFLGLNEVRIRKVATASYQASLVLGSPENEFGTNPETVAGSAKNYWLTVEGPAEFKENGDRYSTNECTNDVPASGGNPFVAGRKAFNCLATRTPNKNSEYAADGLLYTVTVPAAVAGPVTVEVYDPMLVAGGDAVCSSGYTQYWDTNAPASWKVNPLVGATRPIKVGNWNINPVYPTVAQLGTIGTNATAWGLGSNPTQRYAGGSETAPNPYCVGEYNYGGAAGTANPTQTRFTVYNRSVQDNAPLSGGPIGGSCTQNYGGFMFKNDLIWGDGTTLNSVNSGNAALDTGTKDVNGRSATVFQLLNPADGVFDNGAGTRTGIAPQVVNSFHRWVTLCTLPTTGTPAMVAAGTYTIQVQTTAGMGANSFSLRARTGGFPGNLTVAGRDRFVLYANTPAQPSGPTIAEFYLTRLPGNAAGATLQLDFFDTGDTRPTLANSGGASSLDFEILAPKKADNLTAQAFTNCQFDRYAAVDNPTTPAASVTRSNCDLTGLTSAVYQGGLVRATISIPSTYTCHEWVDPTAAVLVADPLGCWVKLRMIFPQGTAPNDVTSWEAKLLRNAIRLIPST
jgi:Flp pilus assembly protein TadG